jgi:hypothetical protein
MATAKRLIFLEFLKASIADLITLLFSSLQNSKDGGDGDSGDSCADPCQFLPFPKTIIYIYSTGTSIVKIRYKNIELCTLSGTVHHPNEKSIYNNEQLCPYVLSQ